MAYGWTRGFGRRGFSRRGPWRRRLAIWGGCGQMSNWRRRRGRYALGTRCGSLRRAANSRWRWSGRAMCAGQLRRRRNFTVKPKPAKNCGRRLRQRGGLRASSRFCRRGVHRSGIGDGSFSSGDAGKSQTLTQKTLRTQRRRARVSVRVANLQALKVTRRWDSWFWEGAGLNLCPASNLLFYTSGFADGTARGGCRCADSSRIPTSQRSDLDGPPTFSRNAATLVCD